MDTYYIIKRKIILGGMRYRREDGRLVADPSEAKVYPSASAALAAAQEGDVIEQASGLNKDA